MKTVALNIKYYMFQCGYTQRELAEKSGCTEAAISRYIKNQREPMLPILKRIAEALNIPVVYLLEETKYTLKSPTDR